MYSVVPMPGFLKVPYIIILNWSSSPGRLIVRTDKSDTYALWHEDRSWSNHIRNTWKSRPAIESSSGEMNQLAHA